MTTQTVSIDREIARIEKDLAGLRQDLADLDERGIYRVTLDNGQTLEAQLTGDVLRLDPADLLTKLPGGQSQTEPAPSVTDTSFAHRYLPYVLIGGGAVVLLFVVMMVLGRMVRSSPPTTSATQQPVSTPTPAAVTPTPMPTLTPTPALIPSDFIARAPIQLSLPSLGLKWDVYKGAWKINGDSITLAEEGDKIRYYNSFVGEGNTVIGGNGESADDPFYAMRSADINDVVRVKDRAGRIFSFRLLPFGGDRVERLITPTETRVANPTDYIALTIIIRIDDETRMVLRGKLYAVDMNE